VSSLYNILRQERNIMITLENGDGYEQKVCAYGVCNKRNQTR